MSKILKNNTASPVFIIDTGVTVPASGSYTLPSQDYLIWAASSNVITKISDLFVSSTVSTLTVNDGSVDLNISDGTDLIKGLYPRLFVFTPFTQLLPMPSANTEYFLALPTGTKRFTIYNRDNGIVKLNYVTGFTTVYESIYPGVKHKEDWIGAANITVFVQSPKPAQTLEITTWT